MYFFVDKDKGSETIKKELLKARDYKVGVSVWIGSVGKYVVCIHLCLKKKTNMKFASI